MDKDKKKLFYILALLCIFMAVILFDLFYSEIVSKKIADFISPNSELKIEGRQNNECKGALKYVKWVIAFLE